MTGNIEFENKEDYILATIPDTVITLDRANEILSQILEQSINLECNKVILDERTVETRDVTTADILKISSDMTNKEQHKIYIAFLCNKKLINKDTKLLRMFTYKNEFLIQYFTDFNEAREWLKSSSKSQ